MGKLFRADGWIWCLCIMSQLSTWRFILIHYSTTTNNNNNKNSSSQVHIECRHETKMYGEIKSNEYYLYGNRQSELIEHGEKGEKSSVLSWTWSIATDTKPKPVQIGWSKKRFSPMQANRYRSRSSFLFLFFKSLPAASSACIWRGARFLFRFGMVVAVVRYCLHQFGNVR